MQMQIVNQVTKMKFPLKTYSYAIAEIINAHYVTKAECLIIFK